MIFDLLNDHSLLSAWVPVALATSVSEAPFRAQAFDLPLVLWRDAGKVNALHDVCPHRGAPLSRGEIDRGLLVCPYHAWKFDRNGICRSMPGWTGDRPQQQPAVGSYHTCEAFGLVWISKAVASSPNLGFEENGNIVIYEFEDSVVANPFLVLENAFDLSHFSYVHADTFSDATIDNKPSETKYHAKEYGFLSEYTVPISASGEFDDVFLVSPKTARVRAHYIAPFAQIFEVDYDTGDHYTTVQATCPIGLRETRYFQLCFAAELKSKEGANRLLHADHRIWLEDKEIIEASYSNGLISDEYFTETHVKMMKAAVELIRLEQ